MAESVLRQMWAGVVCLVLGHKRERQVVRSIVPGVDIERVCWRCMRRGCMSWAIFEDPPKPQEGRRA